MKININDTTKIDDALDRVQRRATVRTLDHADICHMVARIESHLNLFDVPKKLWRGCRATYGETITVKAYGNRYSSTEAVIERGASGWFMVNCGRTQNWVSPGNKNFYICPTEAIEQWLRDNIVEQFRQGWN